MKREIRFYKPVHETIPTELRLYAGDVYVTYEKILAGYRFRILTKDNTEALAIAADIAEVIIQDKSEPEHGVRLETESFKIVEEDERVSVGVVVDWTYRIRDSW